MRRIKSVILVLSVLLSVSVSADELIFDPYGYVALPNVRESSGVLFDDAIRDALRAESKEGRSAAATVSDVGVATIIAYPFVIDAVGAAWLGRGDGRLALRMFLVDGAAELATSGVTYLTKKLVGRERPYGPECDHDPTYDKGCSTSARNLSFFSGHTSSSFASAGIVCSHAMQLNLYGNETAEIAACSISLGVASTIGVLRIVADKHFATDVLAGAAVGTLMGFLVPALARYQSGSDDRGSEPLPSSGGYRPFFQFGGSFR